MRSLRDFVYSTTLGKIILFVCCALIGVLVYWHLLRGSCSSTLCLVFSVFSVICACFAFYSKRNKSNNGNN